MPRVRFDKLLDYWTPQMRKAFYQAIRNVTNSAQIEQLAIAIQNRDMETALKAIDLNPVNFRPIDQTMWASFEAGGNATAATFPLLGEAGSLRTIFRFDVRNPAAEQWISDYSSTMVTEIVDGQREMIRQFLTRAMEQGINPRQAALDLVGRIGPSGYREGGIIGLTSSQEQWVNDYAEALMGDNPLDALDYNLRDARYDKLIKRIVAEDDVLSADQIENMIGSYTNRALKYRADTIARTEMLTSLGEAQQQAMDQAVEQGLIEKDNVYYVWRTARDDRVRDSHAMLEGEKQKMGDVFSNGLAYPGDPSGPPEEVINCFPAGTEVCCENINLGYRRWYAGKLVKITTASGRTLTATPNHPILTRRGWVAVSKLNESDDIICRPFAQNRRSLAEPNVDDVPAPIEQVFNALSIAGNRMRTCGTVMDFHGDGTYRNVDIVRAKGHLVGGNQTALAQKAEHLLFASAEEISTRSSPLCSSAEVGKRSLLASDRGVSVRDLPLSSGSAHARPLQPFGGRLVTDWNLSLGENPPDHEAPDSKAFSGGVLRISGDIESDKIIYISQRNFVGHVFNLETESGHYIANGIVVSNCRCWLEPAVDFFAGVK